MVKAFGDGYDATGEEESQGHTEEEEDRVVEETTIDEQGPTLGIQQDTTQEQQTKGERHVEFAPLRQDESTNVDEGYLPDDGQDHTEDDLPQNRVDGYQGGDSSIGQTEDEGIPTDMEDDEPK